MVMRSWAVAIRVDGFRAILSKVVASRDARTAPEQLGNISRHLQKATICNRGFDIDPMKGTDLPR